jgi:hypothetical protein
VTATAPEPSARTDAEAPPLFPRPGPAPETRAAWAVVGVVVVVVVSGVLVAGFQFHLFGPRATGSVTLDLAAPSYVTVLCPNNDVYDELYFPIHALVGNVTTAEFGLGILTLENATVAANDTAPLPQPNLPCTGPEPEGWYAQLYIGIHGTIATFPVAEPSGPVAWSNATTRPVSVTAGEEFILITDGDFTGTGDHLVAYSTGPTSVGLGGNTTFPSFRHP